MGKERKGQIWNRYHGKYAKETIETEEHRFVVEMPPTMENGEKVHHLAPFLMRVEDSDDAFEALRKETANSAKANAMFSDRKQSKVQTLFVLTACGPIRLGTVFGLALRESEKTHVGGKRLMPKVVRLARIVSRKLIGYAFAEYDADVTLKAWNGETENDPFLLTSQQKAEAAADMLLSALKFN